MTDPLRALSPLDGRYAEATAPLREHFSEESLPVVFGEESPSSLEQNRKGTPNHTGIFRSEPRLLEKRLDQAMGRLHSWNSTR